MLVFNIMISLEFEKDKTLPSLTLTELGNRAYAQGENGSGGNCMPKPINVSCTAGGPGASQCAIEVVILGQSKRLEVTCVTEGDVTLVVGTISLAPTMELIVLKIKE
jgi:hypothetical protein